MQPTVRGRQPKMKDFARPARRTDAALELLASCPDGSSERLLRAHGFNLRDMIKLVRAGLVTSSSERVVVGKHTREVVTLRITEAGRRAVKKQDQ